jgi:hypothetical protein
VQNVARTDWIPETRVDSRSNFNITMQTFKQMRFAHFLVHHSAFGRSRSYQCISELRATIELTSNQGRRPRHRLVAGGGGSIWKLAAREVEPLSGFVIS